MDCPNGQFGCPAMLSFVRRDCPSSRVPAVGTCSGPALPLGSSAVDRYTSSTYGDGYADIYDDWYDMREETGASVAWLSRVADGRPILELGVGTGRVAVPLAATGLEVWGIDSSLPMLERLREKPDGSSVRTVHTEMSTIALPNDAPPFGIAFAAYNTFFMMTTREEQLDCLRRIAALLTTDGVAVLDLFIPRGLVSPSGGVEVTSLALDRLVLRAYRRWPTANTFEGQHVEITDAGVRLRPWSMRVMTPTELDALADEAGLCLADRWAGWNGEPFTDGSRRHISVYKRAEIGSPLSG